jgi:hypothetical protein
VTKEPRILTRIASEIIPNNVAREKDERATREGSWVRPYCQPSGTYAVRQPVGAAVEPTSQYVRLDASGNSVTHLPWFDTWDAMTPEEINELGIDWLHRPKHAESVLNGKEYVPGGVRAYAKRGPTPIDRQIALDYGYRSVEEFKADWDRAPDVGIKLRTDQPQLKTKGWWRCVRRPAALPAPAPLALAA